MNIQDNRAHGSGGPFAKQIIPLVISFHVASVGIILKFKDLKLPLIIFLSRIPSPVREALSLVIALEIIPATGDVDLLPVNSLFREIRRLDNQTHTNHVARSD